MAATVLGLSMSLSWNAAAQSETDFGTTIPTVTVNGNALMKIVPDVIHISITLREADSKGKVSLAEQQKKMRSALKKCNIDLEKQLSVLDMNNVFNRRKGSLASSKYELRVSTAAEARKVFDALDAEGITNVSVTRTSVSNIAEKRAEARKLAIQNARDKASELAEAIGQSIGYCYEINDYSNDYQEGAPVVMKSARVYNLAEEAASEEVFEEDVEFQEHTIRYAVSAKFLLKFKAKK